MLERVRLYKKVCLAPYMFTQLWCEALGFPHDYEHVGALLIPVLGGDIEKCIIFSQKMVGLERTLELLIQVAEEYKTENKLQESNLSDEIGFRLFILVLEDLINGEVT